MINQNNHGVIVLNMCFDIDLHTEYAVNPITQKRYPLNDVIGRGGFSVVYKSSRLFNVCAVKVINKIPNKPISFTHKLYQNEIKILNFFAY